MTHLQKLRTPVILKWVSLYSLDTYFRSSRIILCPTGTCHIAQDFRFYGTKNAEISENVKELVQQIPKTARKQAQAALLEYLHSTRSMQFMDAEHMSKNSPFFIAKLLKRVDNKAQIARSLTRYLRYHPINEFEPFFESMGLKPSEYSSFLPRQLMFLNDDPLLIENYHVLCNYGIERNKIGKIYKETPEVFRYSDGVLQSNLKSFENAGLNQSMVIKLVALSPNVLAGNVNRVFVEVLGRLKTVGIAYDWMEGYLLEGHSYNWSCILEVFCLLSKIGCSEEQLGRLLRQHPELLFASSACTTFSLVGFLIKFGFAADKICTIFLQFPQIPVWKFVENMQHCYHFLIDIEMGIQDIGMIVYSHPLLLGSCSLKKASSIKGSLGTGKKRVSEIIKENPEVLKNWVRGKKVKRLPISEEELRSQMMKAKFLLDLGFVENSREMKRALKLFRGKGVELQERFDCFVTAGLNPNDVSEMVKGAPQILNQSKDVIETKLNFLLNDLRYPLSVLKDFPAYITYTIQRVKLRMSMYNWLKDAGAVDPKLALSTLIACSETYFMATYVNSHPRGPKVWESLQRKIYHD